MNTANSSETDQSVSPGTVTTTASKPLSAIRRHTTGERVNKRGQRLLWRFGAVGWFTMDWSVALLSVLTANMLTPYRISAMGGIGTVPIVPLCIGYSVLLATLAHISGLHDPRYPRRALDLIGRIALVVSSSLILLTLELLLVHYLKIGRFVLLFTAAFSIVGMVTARLVVWYFSDNFAQRVCFLGDDRFCFEAAQFLDEHPLPFNITAATPESEQELNEWAVDEQIDEIVYDPFSESVDEESLLGCLEQAIKISSYPDFVESNYYMVPVEDIDAHWLFSAQLELAHPYYNGIKRIFDVLASLLGTILIAPVMLVVMIAIKLESRGPIFYSQMRVGRFNRHFRIYKLRTMVQDAEKNGAQWAQHKDNRITRIGNLLRRTRLDESPQFWNILNGDMSLVGPRPERPEFVQMLQEKVPFYVQRHLVKPGLSGWAQINYPYGSSIEDSRNKLKFDLFYVKRSSITLDIQIILRTIGAVMKGAR